MAAAANDPGERGGSRAAGWLLAPPSCGVPQARLVGRRCACRSRSPARSPRSPWLLRQTPRAALRPLLVGRGVVELHDLVGHVDRLVIVEERAAGGLEHERVAVLLAVRSEERRVGKECRYRWWP